jgi:hypothetical protein
MSKLPAHDEHQKEAEEKKDQPGDAVLDPDHLMIGRKDPLPPETGFVVVIVGVMIVVAVSVCGRHT